MLQGTRTRRRRIPPFRRRELPSIYLAVLVFGLVAPLLPPLGPPAVPITAPAVAPAPPPEPLPVQVQLVAPAPVVPRAALLNRLADSHTVALTFDDGPDPRWTPQILAILKQHGAVATFCMVSRNVAGQEALVRQLVDAGMRLCDHSHTHDELLPNATPTGSRTRWSAPDARCPPPRRGRPSSGSGRPAATGRPRWPNCPPSTACSRSAGTSTRATGNAPAPTRSSPPFSGRSASRPRRPDRAAARRRRLARADGGGAGEAHPVAGGAGLPVRLPGPLIPWRAARPVGRRGPPASRAATSAGPARAAPAPGTASPGGGAAAAAGRRRTSRPARRHRSPRPPPRRSGPCAAAPPAPRAPTPSSHDVVQVPARPGLRPDRRQPQLHRRDPAPGRAEVARV